MSLILFVCFDFQRQRSLLIVNIIDLVIKVVILIVTLHNSDGAKHNSASGFCGHPNSDTSIAERVASNISRTLRSLSDGDSYSESSSVISDSFPTSDYTSHLRTSGSSAWSQSSHDSQSQITSESGDDDSPASLLPLIIWTIIGAAANIILGILAGWPRFANSYLHFGALLTWIILCLQGKPGRFLKVVL